MPPDGEAMGTPDRVRELFDIALDQPPEKRESVISRLAAGDPALLQEVLSLLRLHEATGGPLDDGVESLFPLADDDDSSQWIGRHIGPYRIVREINRGGMGTVFEAIRDDAEYSKRVAIKLIRSDLRGSAIVRRFRRERQILAALDHPNIAHLLDGGIAPDSRPYFVIEFVDGIAIDKYCDAHSLTIRERIVLFIDVCSAVQYAHRNLVIHRDIKPGNVLVSSDGVPKLLDFGVAKLLEGDDDSPDLTADARFLTPEYASPEQLRGDRVSTLSDVYSLGLVLYVLLAGRLPFEADPKSPLRIERILTTEPRRPSAAVSEPAARARGDSGAARLRRRLAGELDNIALTAIRTEPTRRYASPQDLADDLRRYLDGRVVLAQADTAGYRLKKFVRRNSVAVAAAALIVISLAGGLLASLVEARRAQRESAKEQQVTTFLQRMIGEADPRWPAAGARTGPNTTVLDAINRAAGRIGNELSGQPDVEATIRRTIGTTYTGLGLTDSAEPHLRIALALDRLSDRKPTRALAEDLQDLGAVRIVKGDYREGTSLLREAIRDYAAIGDTLSASFANAANDLSTGLARQGNQIAAESLAVRAVALYRRNYGDSHASVAMAFSNLATIRNSLGDLPGAEHYLRESLAAFDRAGGRDYVERGVLMANFGILRKWAGAYRESDSLLSQAIGIMTRTAGTHFPLIAIAWIERGYSRYLAGNPVGANDALEHASDLLRLNGVPPTHPDEARLETVKGLVLIDLGRAREAESLLRRALASREKSYGPSDPRTAETEGALGLALRRLGRATEAKPLLDASRAQLGKSYGANDPRTRLAEHWSAE
jgi:serine/threonine protein kinase/tetratricopeptide (TPR) repeat protein